MEKEFGISTLVSGSPGILYITKPMYYRILQARKNLFDILAIEDNFDLAFESFCDYENTLLTLSARFMIFNELDYFLGGNDKIKIINRIVNLLTCCTMYLDQSSHFFSCIYGKDSQQFQEQEIAKHNQYDSTVEYRIVDSLRDYVQHRGFPVHSISYPSRLTDLKNVPNSSISYSVTPYLGITVLSDDIKIKSSVKKDMKEYPNQTEYGIDIRPLIRQYMESIGLIHLRIRELLDPDINQWEKTIFSVAEMYKSEFGKDQSLLGLSLCRFDVNRHLLEQIRIFNEFIERRHKLVLKNHRFTNLHKRFVTNECIQKEN